VATQWSPQDPREAASAIARLPRLSALPPRALSGSFHASFAIILPRVTLIMRAAAQPKILDRVLAAHRPRLHMVELQAAPRATSPTIWRDVAALPTIAQEYRARDRRWTATPRLGVGGWIRH